MTSQMRMGIVVEKLISVSQLTKNGKVVNFLLYYELDEDRYSLFRERSATQRAVQGYDGNMELLDVDEGQSEYFELLFKVARKPKPIEVSYRIANSEFYKFSRILAPYLKGDANEPGLPETQQPASPGDSAAQRASNHLDPSQVPDARSKIGVEIAETQLPPAATQGDPSRGEQGMTPPSPPRLDPSFSLLLAPTSPAPEATLRFHSASDMERLLDGVGTNKTASTQEPSRVKQRLDICDTVMDDFLQRLLPGTDESRRDPVYIMAGDPDSDQVLFRTTLDGQLIQACLLAEVTMGTALEDALNPIFFERNGAPAWKVIREYSVMTSGQYLVHCTGTDYRTGTFAHLNNHISAILRDVPMSSQPATSREELKSQLLRLVRILDEKSVGDNGAFMCDLNLPHGVNLDDPARTFYGTRSFRPAPPKVEAQLTWVCLLQRLAEAPPGPLPLPDRGTVGLVGFAALIETESFSVHDYPLVEVEVRTLADGSIVRCVWAPNDKSKYSLHGMRRATNVTEWMSQLYFIILCTLARANKYLPNVRDNSLIARALDACAILREGNLYFATPDEGKPSAKSDTLRLSDLWNKVFSRSPGPEALFWSNYSLFPKAFGLQCGTSLHQSRVAFFSRFQPLVLDNWRCLKESGRLQTSLSVKDMFVLNDAIAKPQDPKRQTLYRKPFGMSDLDDI